MVGGRGGTLLKIAVTFTGCAASELNGGGIISPTNNGVYSSVAAQAISSLLKTEKKPQYSDTGRSSLRRDALYSSTPQHKVI